MDNDELQPEKMDEPTLEDGQSQSEQTPAQTAKTGEPRQRADPTFKRLTGKEVTVAELKEKSNEFKIQEISSPDLFIEIPEGKSVKGTLFDFCRQYSIIEFKSYNDPLNREKMHNQMARVHWWAKQHKEVDVKDILNVIVSAAYPEKFLEN